MKKKGLRTAACVMLVGTVLTAFVAVAGDVGSQADPLVTLSYLNETFMGQLTTKLEEMLAARTEALKAQWETEVSSKERELLSQLGGATGTSNTAIGFTAVTLAAGQTLYGESGCEVMLRSGDASCYAAGGSTPGLVDSTDGTILAHGAALALNHLYLMTDQRGIVAGSAVTLLVRGSYQIR